MRLFDRLPELTEGKRFQTLIVGYVFFTSLYLAAGALNLGPVLELQATALDRRIPLIESSIWLYCSHFLLVVLAVLWTPTTALRNQTLYSMALATLVACGVFVLCPTVIPRFEFKSKGATGALWLFVYGTDVHGNCVPSLHVALAWISARGLSQRGFLWSVFMPLWACLISISTLTTKQHYWLDLATGAALSVCAWRFVEAQRSMTR